LVCDDVVPVTFNYCIRYLCNASVWLVGQIGMSPKDIARVMTEAVVEFAAKSPVHLHQITVCIFQPPMLQEFADAVASKASSSSSRKQTVRGVKNFFLYASKLVVRRCQFTLQTVRINFMCMESLL